MRERSQDFATRGQDFCSATRLVLLEAGSSTRYIKFAANVVTDSRIYTQKSMQSFLTEAIPQPTIAQALTTLLVLLGGIFTWVSRLPGSKSDDKDV